MSTVFLVIALIFAGIAALLHVVIFVMESVMWTRPVIWKRFGLHSSEEAETIKPMALNQGFYNLFLAIGAVIGLVLVPTSSTATAGVVALFLTLGSMFAASLVLVISNPKLARAAVTQGITPLIAMIALVIAVLTA